MELEVGSQANLYQVHFSEEKVGKMMKNSKMKIVWIFRESDIEHIISLIWSKTTGKQQIEMDGTLIWFGRNPGRSVLDHNWTTRDERLKLHLLATCAPKVNENFRNFDLVINGQLFAALPHYGREGSNAPIPPPVGKDNLNSIIQILYPDGYVPPVEKEEQQQQQEGHHQHNIVVAPPQRDNAMATETTTANDHNDKNDNTNSSSSSSDLVVDLLGEDTMVLAPQVQQQHQVVVDLLG